MIRRRAVLLLSCLLCSVVALRAPLNAAQPPKADPKVLYDCQNKAAEYTRNLGKPGDKDIYEQHLKLCLEVSQASSALGAARRCGANEVPLTFQNRSGETIWIGAWDGDNLVGPAAPQGMPNWRIDNGKDGVYCVPTRFSGRFTTRAGCDESTGRCREGDCRADTGGTSMNCSSGTKPASVFEITLDKLNVAWYDVSYVDGYNFPLQVETSTPKCSPLGGKNLPSCPWPTVDGVCLAPYLQYAIENPWYAYEQDYYILAAACAANDNATCGCGNQCTSKPVKRACPDSVVMTRPYDGAKVTIESSGCSPFIASYGSDVSAANQLTCDPLTPKKAGSKCHEWNEKYKKYAVSVHAASPKAYTWQYHDNDSLSNCARPDDLAFTVTAWPRPPGKEGNRKALNVAVGADIEAATLQVFSPASSSKGLTPAPTPIGKIGFMTLAMPGDARIVIDRQCKDSSRHLECSLNYSSEGVLSFSDKGSKDCSNSNGNIALGVKGLLSLGMPAASACVPKNARHAVYSIYNGSDTEFFRSVNGGKEQKNEVPGNYQVELADNDKVTLRVGCMGGAELICNTTYSLQTGLLSVGPDEKKNCGTVLGRWGQAPNELHPGKPAERDCK